MGAVSTGSLAGTPARKAQLPIIRAPDGPSVRLAGIAAANACSRLFFAAARVVAGVGLRHGRVHAPRASC